MSDIAVKAEQLSKRYRLGVRDSSPDTLGAALAQALKAPVRNLGRLRGLSRFDDSSDSAADVIWAINDVSFEIKVGERVGIIGRNGAGKSTLLKILSRITEPTKGRVTTRGRVSSLLEVGTGFHPELTGRENMYLNGTVLGMSKREIDGKFDEIVDFSGVEKFLETPVKRYSSGMAVRLAFSVAAHLEPEILLVDEVLAVGDAEFQRKCLGKMESATSDGRTVLFVSHNLSAVKRLCPRAILLDHGQVMMDGEAMEVTSRYLKGDQAAGTSAVTTWSLDEAPGREVKLTSVGVSRSDGEPAMNVGIEDEIALRIGYRVSRPDLRFRVMARLYHEGAFAFPTIEPNEQVRETVGEYESVVTIPANLLSEGEYTVGITIFTSAGAIEHFVRVEDVLAFHVFDPIEGTSARGDYAQNLHGPVRPLLKWQLRKHDRPLAKISS